MRFGSATPYVVIGGLLVIGLVVLRILHVAKKSSADSVDFALARAWRHVATDPSLLDLFSGGFVTQGTNRRNADVIIGTKGGRAITAFRYLANHERDLGIPETEVIVVGLPASVPSWVQLVRLPTLTPLQPEPDGIFITFDHPEFDEVWQVQAAERSVAEELLSPRLRQYLVDGGHMGVGIRFEGQNMAWWTPGPRNHDFLDLQIASAVNIVNLVDPAVWDRMQRR